MKPITWEEFNTILITNSVNKNSQQKGNQLFLQHYESYFKDTSIGTGKSVNIEIRDHVSLSLIDIQLKNNVSIQNDYNIPFVGLYLCVNGRAEVNFSTETLSAGQWCIYCVPKGVYDFRLYGTSEQRYSVIGIFFSPESFQKFLGSQYARLPDEVKEGIKNLVPYGKSGSYSAELHDRVLQLMNCTFDKFHDKLKLEGLLYELFSYIIENFENEPPPVESYHFKAVNNVCKMILEQPFSHPSTAVLAQQAGMSESLLYKVFKSVYGISTSQFILESKLLAAKALLESEDISVNEVAFKSGYESVSSFSRVFKKKFGFRPGEIIRNRT